LGVIIKRGHDKEKNCERKRKKEERLRENGSTKNKT
jgi:hypothetical protein